MFIQLIRFVFILVGAVGGYQSAIGFGLPSPGVHKNIAIIIYMVLGAAIGYVFGGVVGRRLFRSFKRIENSLHDMHLTELAIGIGGLVSGLVISFLITMPFALITIPVLRFSLTLFVYAAFAWIGVRLGVGRRREVGEILNIRDTSGAATASPSRSVGDKLLDTNIIIDGRIIDILQAGWLEGRIVVPRFVLHELQAVADSDDDLKRIRGRRGLEVLGSLQTDLNIKVQISEADYPDIYGVDAKLVRLALDTGAVLVTNDFNLNKVAQVEGVRVLNLNDLANAVKAVVLPGEEMAVKIVREGKEAGQGVGYLDDGTMVVVEDGSGQMGNHVELKVTSVLQTPAGKMIFTKIKTAARI